MAATYLEYPSTIGAGINHWISFESFKFKEAGTPNLNIALYIPPDALSTSYKSSYESQALGQMAGRALETLNESGGSLFKLKNMLSAKGAAAGAVITDIGVISSSTGATRTIMEQSRGAVVNPYIVAAYKGPSDLREHKFSFKMMPEDENESKTCVKIVNEFKAAMLPSHKGGNNQTAPSGLFGYPDEFVITYYINGEKLPNDATNPMFNIGKSVLTSCDMSYTTQDLPVFFEGTQYPVSIQMSLTFMELDIMIRERITGHAGFGIVGGH